MNDPILDEPKRTRQKAIDFLKTSGGYECDICKIFRNPDDGQFRIGS